MLVIYYLYFSSRTCGITVGKLKEDLWFFCGKFSDGIWRNLNLLTVVYCAETSITKFFRRVEIFGGFFKFSIGEDRNPKVDTAAFEVFV